MVNLDITDHNRLLVSFPYSEILVAKVKGIDGGRWDKERRVWKLPLTKLDEVLATFPAHWKEPRLAKYIERVECSEALRKLKDAPQPLGIVLPLMRFQRVAVNFLVQINRAILLSRGVGVGKSLVGIGWGNRFFEDRGLLHRGVLVVTKSAGKYPYRDEILRAIPSARVALVSGEQGYFPRSDDADFVILNYDILYQRRQQVIDRGFAAVVFSESHKLKDMTTLRAQAALEIAKQVPNVLLETASFTPNRNAEAFSQLCIIGLYDPKEDYYPFHMRFCDPKRVVINRRGTTRLDLSGSSNSEELHRIIAPFTYTILREEALPELPKVRFMPVLTDHPNAAEYRVAEKNFLAWVKEKKGEDAAKRAKKALAITRMNALLELAALGNVKAAEDYIETCLEAGEKVLVFSSYKKPLKKLHDKFPGLFVLITGDESAQEKFVSVAAFQNDPKVRGCLCSTEAGGESVTMTAATTVIFLSLPWSPAQFSQAFGRSDRLGQKKSIQVIVLIGRQTLQVEQVEMLYNKELDISMVVSGSDRSPNSEALRKIVEQVKGGEAKQGLPASQGASTGSANLEGRDGEKLPDSIPPVLD